MKIKRKNFMLYFTKVIPKLIFFIILKFNVYKYMYQALKMFK